MNKCPIGPDFQAAKLLQETGFLLFVYKNIIEYFLTTSNTSLSTVVQIWLNWDKIKFYLSYSIYSFVYLCLYIVLIAGCCAGRLFFFLFTIVGDKILWMADLKVVHHTIMRIQE